jgi:hypothetical protein
MILNIRDFARKYPTWEDFMSAVTGPEAGSTAIVKELGGLLGEDLAGIVREVRRGANSGNAGPLVQVNMDLLTNKYYAIRRAAHS